MAGQWEVLPRDSAPRHDKRLGFIHDSCAQTQYSWIIIGSSPAVRWNRRGVGLFMDHLRGKAIIASGFHTTRPGEIDFFQNALIAVGNDGAILSVHRPHEKGYAEEKEKHTGRLVSLPHGSYLLPGFVDLHVHAAPYPQLASA